MSSLSFGCLMKYCGLSRFAIQTIQPGFRSSWMCGSYLLIPGSHFLGFRLIKGLVVLVRMCLAMPSMLACYGGLLVAIHWGQ